VTDTEKLAKVLPALEGLYAMVAQNPAIKADDRFVTAGVVLGELKNAQS
jgi:hypothetical protein